MKRVLWSVTWLVACGGGDGRSNLDSAWDPADGGSTSEDGGDVEDSGTAPDPGSTGGGGGDTSPDPTTPSDESSESSDGGGACLPSTSPCATQDECCPELECGTTSLGQVCCGNEGIPCATANGEDCCGDLLCIDGVCGYNLENVCEAPCTEAPALVIEKNRLTGTIGGSWLGICGDANHTYGYHVPPANLPSDDYSLEGAANTPTCEWQAAAIDIGMDWPASRDWLMWLIPAIASDEITGIAEVIGSYDGVNVRYWSDNAGWSVEGIPYTGQGHDSWTHVAIYRSTTLEDHHILDGWTADGPE